MRSIPVEPWDQVGNNVDICEDLVDERANSASSDDDVARMRVTIFLTLDRAGRVMAEVKEVVHKAGAGRRLQSHPSASHKDASRHFRVTTRRANFYRIPRSHTRTQVRVRG